jgi:ABC-2 type transport system ATP-binding protein
VLRITSVSGPATTTALMAMAAQAEVAVLSLSVKSTTLDDDFVHYTGHELRDGLQEMSMQEKAAMFRRGR